METLLDRKQAAEFLQVSPGTLGNWACSGFRKIPYVKIGRHVRYRANDLEKWIAAQVVNPVEVSQ